MIAKFVAKVGISIGIGAVALAQYWFTFGLWPKSWTSFVLCTISSIVLMACSMAIDNEK